MAIIQSLVKAIALFSFVPIPNLCTHTHTPLDYAMLPKSILECIRCDCSHTFKLLMKRMCLIYLNNVPAVDYIHFQCDDASTALLPLLPFVRYVNGYGMLVRTTPYHLGSKICSTQDSFGREKCFLLFVVV